MAPVIPQICVIGRHIPDQIPKRKDPVQKILGRCGVVQAGCLCQWVSPTLPHSLLKDWDLPDQITQRKKQVQSVDLEGHRKARRPVQRCCKAPTLPLIFLEGKILSLSYK